MLKQRLRILSACLALCVASQHAIAQDVPSTGATEDSIPTPAKELKLEQLAAKFLADLASKRLDSLDLQFIEPDNEDAEGGWGVRYQWGLEKADSKFGEMAGRWAMRKLAYSADLQGTYAFSDADNNEEHSTAKVAVRMERANFGALQFIANAASEAFQDCLTDLPEDTDDPTLQRKQDEMEMKCWTENGIADVVRSSYGGYSYWLDFHGGVEGNQDYSDSQTLYGLSVGLASEPTRGRAMFNLPDLPFRLLRGLGDDSSYVAPFPSVMLSLERLDADSDSQRVSLTNDSTYTRGSAEVAFQTIVANFGGRPLRFNVSYRYFSELSPPDAIKAADLDEFQFWRASLRFPAHLVPFVPSDDYELFVAYTSGRLPFDQTSDQAVQLGFTTNFKMLGDLLSK